MTTLSPVPPTVPVGAGLSIFDYAPNHDIAHAFEKLAEEVDRG